MTRCAKALQIRIVVCSTVGERYDVIDVLGHHPPPVVHVMPEHHWTDPAPMRMTEQGIEHLVHTPQLKRLKLSGLPITDAGLLHLQHLAELEELDLNGTLITDAGLVHLRGLIELRELQFMETSISYDAAADLHASLPLCRISDNWCCGCMAFEPHR